MADVTGPISSLPGSHHKVPNGMMCDECSKYPATYRVQGETDSMGCEMIDLCPECYKKDKEAEKNVDYSGTCDWCKSHSERVSPTRDYEEGLYGPVYYVCSPCRTNYNKKMQEEYDETYDRYEYDDYE